MSFKSHLGTWKPWISVLLVALAIFLGSSLPGTSLPPPRLFPGQDKVVHLLEYGLLGFVVARALAQSRGGAGGAAARFFATCAFTLLFGVSDEFHQSFVPARSVEAMDLLADLAGGATGAAVLLLVRARKLRGDLAAQPLRRSRSRDH